jgi:hypothetical protein
VSLRCVEDIASWHVLQAWPRDVVYVQVPHMMHMSHVIGDLQQQYSVVIARWSKYLFAIFITFLGISTIVDDY